ncbi:DUF2785 domain-containing protein, partial [Bacillus sp. HC-TM]
IYYKYEEDERLVYPIVAMLQNGLKEEVLLLALHELVAQLPVKKQTLHTESYEYLYGNIKSFLRSLFFRLRTLSICEETECKIEKLLQDLPKYY